PPGRRGPAGGRRAGRGGGAGRAVRRRRGGLLGSRWGPGHRRPSPELAAPPAGAGGTRDAGTARRPDRSADPAAGGRRRRHAAPGVPAWRARGPVTVPSGQPDGSSRVNVSGRIAAIATDPSDPAHVLVGAANGGVWESRDRGATWAPRTDAAATLTTGALAFDPSNPGTVLCGTGEGNWWSYLGVGILRSTDGGTTWSTLCGAPFVGQGFYDLRFDPAAAGRLLAGTTGGLYGSTDGGVSWTQRRANQTWSV